MLKGALSVPSVFVVKPSEALLVHVFVTPLSEVRRKFSNVA